jgi:hypothetical protein
MRVSRWAYTRRLELEKIDYAKEWKPQPWGRGVNDGDFTEDGVMVCEQWISMYLVPSDRFYTISSSYGFKHFVEHDLRLLNRRSYVHNNDFIQAMINLGYEMKPKTKLNYFFKCKLSSEYKDRLKKERSKLHYAMWTVGTPHHENFKLVPEEDFFSSPARPPNP